MSFVGSIVGTQGEQVEVAFDIDKTAAGGNRYGFAPATGNLMYCMPQKGTKTALYIGNGDETQGIATGCIRTNGSTCEGTGSPEKKSFRSEHGKGMDLYPQRMEFNGGVIGKITFEDETGTTIESNGGLVLMAKEGIRLESMTGIAMQGMSDIMALHTEGASSLCVNGSVDMLGKMTGLAGTVYQKYDPFEDARQKGEFDWGGFARNLVMGLAVGAACIALAVFLPGIGTVAAGALLGAGMGAICQTAYKASEEWESGNVRGTEEALRDVIISTVSGGFTGACVVAFPVTALFSGEIYAVVSLTGRVAWAFGDSSMTKDEKKAYIFDLNQMIVDFSIGALIGIIVPEAAAEKLVRDAERNRIKSAGKISSEAIKSGSFSKGVGNPVEVVGRGSTGRTVPNTLNEQMAMHQVMSNPLEGAVDMSQLKNHPVIMSDSRWLASVAWVKMSNNVNGVEIHFVYDKITGAFDDFKFK